MKEKLKHIELFAGCGGMTLGLEAAGFELYFANELSPMAGETFSFNIIGENLDGLSGEGEQAEDALWIKSNYERSNLKSRLRENPFSYSAGSYSDLNKKVDFNGKLLIGNIDHLLSFLAKNKSLCQKLRKENIDLVSGGPPCQSFSLAGRREKDNQKNLLPLSFARFAGLVKPKMVLLENVKGITSPFTFEDKKYYAWVEVAKAFSLQGFIPICMMLNSKYFGVPQNRPRFILLAIRKDICQKLLIVKKEEFTINILKSSFAFFNLVQKNKKFLDKVTKNDLKLYDIEKESELFNGQLLPQILTTKENFISAAEAIEDLFKDSNTGVKKSPSNYVAKVNALFKANKSFVQGEIKNLETRKHSFNVKARFRWFQIINNLNGLTRQALKILSNDYHDEKKINLIFEKIKGEFVLIKDETGESRVKIDDRQFFDEYLKRIKTEKHSQRAIKAEEPAPAQMTIPDDLCHYAPDQLRTLTVREMARFQSFPDWFEFRSKVTTGGDQRSFEVPQYTQVGNAVPPLLAYELGNLVKNILNQVKDVEKKN